MSGAGKGKEREVVDESVAVSPSPSASSFSKPIDTRATPTPQDQLPSEPTEGPSSYAQLINPHVSVVSD